MIDYVDWFRKKGGGKVGGRRNGATLASVERLDPGEADATWQRVAPMGKPRWGAGVAVVDQFLYVVGGHDGETCHNGIQ
ncbi:hypothetical protein OSTOST_21935, partial [Ostertagia ostertagi]